MSDPDRILVIKLRYIGDVILSIPVLIRLRKAFPKAHLTMLVNAGNEQVLEGHPVLDEVLRVERSSIARQWNLIRQLRRQRFDLVIDLTDGDRSAILGWLSGAPRRIGYNSENRWRGVLYSQLVQADRFSMHTVRYHMACMEMLGVAGPPPAPSVAVAPEARAAAERLFNEAGVDMLRPIVCLHPGARWWFKQWPAERFAALADRIQKNSSVQALFLGGPQDFQTANRIATAMSTTCRTLVGKTDLQELAAVLERATLLISNDNGPMHLAAAVGTRVVGLFGPSDPAVWGPWGDTHVTLYKHLDCRGCFHPDCFRGEQNCMRLISLEEVWTAVEAALVR